MAQKRMFDKDIISLDNFLDLPMEAKALYFLLGMEADDEGFVSPKKVIRLYGGTEDSIKILIMKGFLIPFDTGVVVITDWKRNNYLDKTRTKDTIYTYEKSQITFNNLTEKYECLTDVKQMLNQYRIEENRVEENSIDQNRIDNIHSPAEAEQCEVLPTTSNQSTTTNLFKEIIGYLNLRTGSDYKHTTKSTQSKINARLNEGFTLNDFKVVIDKKCVEWQDTDMAKFLRPETLFGTKFESYLNQKAKKASLHDIAKTEEFQKYLEEGIR